MADQFETFSPGLDSPARSAVAITPHDSNDLTTTTRALFVGNAGDVAVILAGDTSSVVLKNAAGLLPLRVKRVLSTGTTATSIVGLT